MRILAYGLMVVYLFSVAVSAADTAPMMTLPQYINEESEEPNLKCLFETLRQYDYQRTSVMLPKIEHLYNHVNPGVDRIIDLNTLLLQYYDLQDIDDKETGIKFEPRKTITACNLALEPALERCKSAYPGMDCEQVTYGPGEFNKAPYVSPKCPMGYQRYGCCKCLRKCDYTQSIEADVTAGEDVTLASVWTNVNYCLKKPSFNSDVKSGKEKQEVGIKLNQYEIVEETPGGFVFVQECPKDFKRIGNRTCMAVCPLGWSDMGRKCLKRGEMIFFPFVWQPGDGKVTPKGGESQAAPKSKAAGKK